MRILRTIAAFTASVATTYVLASFFYTTRILQERAAFAPSTPAQQAEAYFADFIGLWIYGAMIAIALLVAFAVAWGVKRVLKPLAPLAYPVAGAAAIFVMLTLVEAQLGGGAGVIGGARTAFGVALQCLAGCLGGAVFAMVRPR